MDIFRKKPMLPARRPVEAVNPDPDQGLTDFQVLERRNRGWSNDHKATAAKTEGEIILANCLTFFNLVFIILAVILVIGGSSVKNMAFLGVVFCNTVIGCVQEIRAKRAVDKLSLVTAQSVRVIRDGQVENIPQKELVLGDIQELSAGDQICADAILRTGELFVNESLITGEADPITKTPGDTLRSGSFVVAGRARVQLTAVGPDSYAARLSAEARNNPQAAKSEMMKSLDKLIRVIGIALIPIGLLLFWQEYKVLCLGLTDSVEGTVAALVGMIPEGLYLLTSIAMAASALKLSRDKVLVQEMNCIETLARVDVLCVDKTGTVTEPAMDVENLIPLSRHTHEELENILAAIYHGTEPENDTARAMAELFARENDWVTEKVIPFSSETKWSAAIFRDRGTYLTGAPESILGSRYDEIRDTVTAWADQGCRVILVAGYRGQIVNKKLDPALAEPLALAVLTSRIRETAPATFRYFAEQGVSVKVISGDNPATVSAVARRAGIENAESYVDASTLETEEDLAWAAENCAVFGRVTPEQKKRLVMALQKNHTVAMTGDGVNDVLAMKQADCGIAMASGAQAASQVADLVLTESDFAAMPGIVAEGRRVINNIQRAATLFLVKNIFSLALSIITIFTNLPYPLVPLHLSVISALTIGVPSFFLAMEPNYERVTGHFLRGVLRRAFPGGLTNIFVVLMAQLFMVTFSLSLEQTAAVCASILGIVGLLVLFRVCKPFDRFRKIIWAAMALGLLICFTALGGLFDLQAGTPQATLIMITLLIMTPTVFSAMEKLFDWGDRIWKKLRNKC